MIWTIKVKAAFLKLGFTVYYTGSGKYLRMETVDFENGSVYFLFVKFVPYFKTCFYIHILNLVFLQ